jgi:hypothetical protein
MTTSDVTPTTKKDTSSDEDELMLISPVLYQQVNDISNSIIDNLSSLSKGVQEIENAVSNQNTDADTLKSKISESLKENASLASIAIDKINYLLEKTTDNLKIIEILLFIAIVIIESFISYLFSINVYFLLGIIILQSFGMYIIYWYADQKLWELKKNAFKNLNKVEIDSSYKLTQELDIDKSIVKTNERSKYLKFAIGNFVYTTKEFIPLLKKGVVTFDYLQRKTIFLAQVRYAISRYNFPLDETLERLINRNSITTDNEDKWLSQISKKIGDATKKGANVIGVIICESGFYQTNLRQFWDKMEDTEFVNLSKILVNHNLIIGKRIKEKTTLAKVLELKLKNLNEDYSLYGVQRAISDLESVIEVFIEQINEISSLFYINAPTEDEIINYIPHDIAHLEDELYNLASMKSKVSKELLYLFRSSILSSNHGKLSLAKVIEVSGSEKLSEFIANRSDLSNELDSISINKILNKHDWIDFFNLKILFENYKKAKQIIQDYHSFLSDQNISLQQVDFSEFVTLLPPNFQTLDAETLEKLGYFLLNRIHFSFEVDLVSLNLAALSVFIFEVAPTGTELIQIYKRTSRNELATKILYLKAQLFDDANFDETKATLMDAINNMRTVRQDYPYEFLLEFKTKLMKNTVHSSIKIMLEGRVRDMSNLIKKKSWDKYYSKLDAQIKTFFNARILQKSIPSLLKYNLVKAYIITSPSQFPLMSTLDSTDFKSEVTKLELKDQNYGELKKIYVGTGNSTRVGVISSKIDFEKFKQMFDNALNSYFENHMDAKGKLKDNHSAAYIMRLYSSKDSMGVIPLPKGDENSLYKRILESMETLVPAEQMSIIAAVKSETSEELSLNTINLDLLNQSSMDIFEFIDNKKFIQEFYENKDKEMKRRVQREILSEFKEVGVGNLCLHLYKHKKDNSLRPEFMKAIERGIKNYTKVKQKKIMEISDSLFDELLAIGNMLS